MSIKLLVCAVRPVRAVLHAFAGFARLLIRIKPSCGLLGSRDTAVRAWGTVSWELASGSIQLWRVPWQGSDGAKSLSDQLAGHHYHYAAIRRRAFRSECQVFVQLKRSGVSGSQFCWKCWHPKEHSGVGYDQQLADFSVGRE
jgi:hypothetical protein